MNRENFHIVSYLDYYCSLEKNPGFAVMLSGKAGAGKTWLVSQYRKSLALKNVKTLYVSLFGINSFDEIENSFFEQLHPAFSKKGLGLSAKILKESIKGTINLEIRKEQISDFKPEDWKVPNYLANTQDHVLIFDDIDRCFLPIPQVFGYVNFLLEHHGYRIILVANEEALQEREDNSHIEELAYQKAADKIVGRTFVVQPDFSEAFQVASERITSKLTQDLLMENKETIREIFFNAKSANLRHLFHSLLDFERLLSCLPANTMQNESFLKHLLTVFFTFSLEIRSKNIQPSDLQGLNLTHAQLFTKSPINERRTPHTYLLNRYKKFKVQNTIFSEDWWVAYFEKGSLNASIMQEELRNSIYFQTDKSLKLNFLSELWDLSNDEFKELQREIQIEFNSHKYLEPGAIKLCVSFMLWAAKNKLSNKDSGQILEEAKKYVEYLVKEKTLKVEEQNSDSEIKRRCWHDHPFLASDSEDFEEFCQFLDKMHAQRVKEEIGQEAIKLVQMMVADPERFSSVITSPRQNDKKYHDIPILSHIPPETFFKAFMELSPGKRLLIAQSLQERYYMKKANRKILPESVWLSSLNDLIKNESLKEKGNLSSFTLKTISEKFLAPSLERLEYLSIERQD